MRLTYCGFCKEGKEEDELDFICRSCVGPYGAIVLCDVFCKRCNTRLIKDKIVDDDGLHPPRRR